MKRFETYINEWEQNAKKDAYWSVLTHPKFERVAWDKSAFFQTGRDEISFLRDYIKKKQIPIAFQGKALDFGCGVGRLTQALSLYFNEVCGIDISKTMLAKAEEEAVQARCSHIQFLHNPHPNLHLFASDQFDFIYSNIVLQHIAPKHQLTYLKEFARVTKKGGWILVQIPSKRLYSSLFRKIRGSFIGLFPYKMKKLILVKILKNTSRALKDFDIEMNTCSEKIIKKLALKNNLEIKHIAYTQSCDPQGDLQFRPYTDASRRSDFLSPLYFMQKMN